VCAAALGNLLALAATRYIHRKLALR